jgi:hypothetical protein
LTSLHIDLHKKAHILGGFRAVQGLLELRIASFLPTASLFSLLACFTGLHTLDLEHHYDEDGEGDRTVVWHIPSASSLRYMILLMCH